MGLMFDWLSSLGVSEDFDKSDEEDKSGRTRWSVCRDVETFS